MNKLILLGAAFMALSFTQRETQPANITATPQTAAQAQNGKTFLMNYFQQTEDRLNAQLEGLTTAQLQFTPSADRWSVSQCVEHIILTEKMLFDMARKALAKPANPERKDEMKLTNQQLIDMVTDRSHKAEATAELIGKGAYTDPETAMADFRAQRKAILAYLDGISADDLRNHIDDSPFGPIDGYHSILFIAGHTARHTLQIEEVKSNPAFPE